MSSKKLKKNSNINAGHYLELMDRIHVIMMNVQDHLLEHPLTHNYKDIEQEIEKAQHNLWEAYQLVGQKEEGYENENNSHK
jgi:xanthine dehydrogenase molybdopterin-binding subunit B